VNPAAPSVSSGVRGSNDPAWHLTFPTAGTYTIYCVFHYMMVQTVTVHATASAAVVAPNAVYAAITSSITATRALLTAWLADPKTPQLSIDMPAPRVVNADGTSTYTMYLGNGVSTYHGQPLYVTETRFFPAQVTIQVGDSVLFDASLDNSTEQHTLSINGSTAYNPQNINNDPAVFPVNMGGTVVYHDGTYWTAGNEAHAQTHRKASA
jgi:plastocyanin